jgi:hypothetical protein
MTSPRNPATSRSRKLQIFAASALLCMSGAGRARAQGASDASGASDAQGAPDGQPAGGPQAEPPVRVDGVAVLVGGNGPGEGVDVILRSDVELRARLALLSDDADRALRAALPPALLSATLSELIGEVLIAREAERVQIASPAAADVQREKQRLIVSAGGLAHVEALLHELGASQAELDAVAKRRAVAAAFLSANLEGAMLVTDNEVELRYQAEAASFAGLDPAKARELIRASLRSEALNHNIERWVRVLQARTPLRIFAKFDTQ